MPLLLHVGSANGAVIVIDAAEMTACRPVKLLADYTALAPPAHRHRGFAGREKIFSAGETITVPTGEADALVASGLASYA